MVLSDFPQGFHLCKLIFQGDCSVALMIIRHHQLALTFRGYLEKPAVAAVGGVRKAQKTVEVDCVFNRKAMKILCFYCFVNDK